MNARFRSRRGQSTVEYALVACVLLGVCFTRVRGVPVYALLWESFVQFASGLLWYYTLPIT